MSAAFEQPTPPAEDTVLRQEAIKQLAKKRDLQAHLLAYVLVNAFLVGIWAITSFGGFFWPMFPILGWGIGMVFHIWDVYAASPSEDRIQQEMRRLRHI